MRTTPEVKDWLTEQRGRVRLEFLPVHASWLNQIEIWFSILERQALRRASDATYADRAQRIYRIVRTGTASLAPFAGP